MKLSIIIPAYNEAENLTEAIQMISSGLPSAITQHEIIVIDDGSRDATRSVLRRLAADDARVRVVHHETNRGKGACVMSGFDHASMDWLLLMDADMQVHIAELSAFLPYTAAYDVIIGFRKSRKDSLLRRILSRCFALLLYLLLGLRARDVNCPFKLFKRSAVEDMRFFSAGFLIDAELLYRLLAKGVRMQELGVESHLRQKGTSTVSFRHAFETGKELMAMVFRKQ